MKQEEILSAFFANTTSPIKLIVGTDWWTDCDDVVAMRVLAWAQKNNLVKIEAIGINACMEYSASSLDSFLRGEGLPRITFGIDFDATDFGGNPPYQKRLAENPPDNNVITNNDCEDAVKVYRKALANSTSPIDIIEIGYPQVLSNLLKSKSDDISPLSGTQLVKQKVRKLWVMAGKWDDPNGGKENNFARNARSCTAAHYLCGNWPTPITFLGFEVSQQIRTGDNLDNDDPLYLAMQDHGSTDGRSSWDPMLVFLAICGDENVAGYDVATGKAHVDENTGVNTFEHSTTGTHCYVIKNREDSFYKELINSILRFR